MAPDPKRYKGIVRNGKIELQSGADVPDGAEVVVLVGEEGTKVPPIRRRVRRRGSTATDLLNSEIFGMWADRTDIKDSAAFVRELRERAWRRAG
ncbi:MAG TPA: hypothetical protein VKT78_14805 [Fimbriimonadaceae bacterium]|nr:hypothetical protein [Fimbriimonadaceae bacterium]